MPNPQLRLVEGAIMSDHISAKVHQGALQNFAQVVDINAVYGSSAAVSLSAGHVFGLLDCTVNTTAANITLPTAASVIQHLQHVRTGASWTFRAMGVTTHTLSILPGTGWNLSGGSAALADRQRLSGQVAEIVCWIVNPAVGSESIQGRVMWSF